MKCRFHSFRARWISVGALVIILRSPYTALSYMRYISHNFTLVSMAVCRIAVSWTKKIPTLCMQFWYFAEHQHWLTQNCLSKVNIDKSSWVGKIFRCQIGTRTLPKPMMTDFYDHIWSAMQGKVKSHGRSFIAESLTGCLVVSLFNGLWWHFPAHKSDHNDAVYLGVLGNIQSSHSMPWLKY